MRLKWATGVDLGAVILTVAVPVLVLHRFRVLADAVEAMTPPNHSDGLSGFLAVELPAFLIRRHARDFLITTTSCVTAAAALVGRT